MVDVLDRHAGAITTVATIVIAAFTIALARSTKKLWKEANRAGETAEKAAIAARDSANAATSTYIPVLYPYVIRMEGLHPTGPANGPVEFDAVIHLVFENVGKTTAIIREARAELFLMQVDEFPQALFEGLPVHSYDEIVPGDTTRASEKVWRAVIEVKKHFSLSQTEYSELLAEGTGRYRRFALLTLVAYDDVFGNRHKARACIKMRLVPTGHPQQFGVFQTPRGGAEYNYITREKIRKNEHASGGLDVAPGP